MFENLQRPFFKKAKYAQVLGLCLIIILLFSFFWLLSFEVTVLLPLDVIQRSESQLKINLTPRHQALIEEKMDIRIKLKSGTFLNGKVDLIKNDIATINTNDQLANIDKIELDVPFFNIFLKTKK